MHGMDIAFSLEPIIDPNYYQNSPDYHGGSIEDSQPWLKKHGKVILEQMDNPFVAAVGNLTAYGACHLTYST